MRATAVSDQEAVLTAAAAMAGRGLPGDVFLTFYAADKAAMLATATALGGPWKSETQDTGSFYLIRDLPGPRGRLRVRIHAMTDQVGTTGPVRMVEVSDWVLDPEITALLEQDGGETA